MRFVSSSARLSLGNFRNAEEAIGASREVVVNGVKRTTSAESYIVTSSIPLQFTQGNLTNSDIQAAKDSLTWPGLPTEGDGVTPIDPAEYGRIGVWDSVEWQKEHKLSDAEREEAENMLLHYPQYGQVYVRVAEVHAPKPWATYDTTHHNKIASLAEDLGCVDDALAYERENKNRESVLAALEGKQPTAVDGELIVA